MAALETADWTIEELSLLVQKCLSEGEPVEIDGLGVFQPDPVRGFRFAPRTRPQVFISYVLEDMAAAQHLYTSLDAAGFSPWMDKRKLLPGQNWPRAIERAIEASDFFMPCFSARSVRKRGRFQAEIRYALDCARLTPLDEIFIVPVRLDDCLVPRSIQRELQYIDLFPEWDRGLRRIKSLLRRQMLNRSAVRE